MMKQYLDKKLWIVTGKGGVGKSSLATSLAIYASSHGKKVTLYRIGTGSESKYLQNRSVDEKFLEADECLKKYIEYKVPIKPISHFISHHKIFEALFKISPGLGDMSVIGRVVFEAGLDSQSESDLVILDAPATGHGIGMLFSPTIYSKIFSRGPIHKDTEEINGFIKNPDLTSLFLITLPEEMPLTETLELQKELEALDLSPSEVFVNRLHVMPFPKELGPSEVSTKAFEFHQKKLSTEIDHCHRWFSEQITNSSLIPEFPFSENHEKYWDYWTHFLDKKINSFEDFEKPSHDKGSTEIGK